MVWNGSDRTHDIGQERGCDTSVPGPPHTRTDDGDNVDGGVDCGGDEDCDTSVPGTHAGCYSRSTATTVTTSLTTTAMVVGVTDRLTAAGCGDHDDIGDDDGCGGDDTCTGHMVLCGTRVRRPWGHHSSQELWRRPRPGLDQRQVWTWPRPCQSEVRDGCDHDDKGGDDHISDESDCTVNNDGVRRS